MDRVAQLAEEAQVQLAFERMIGETRDISGEMVRAGTRKALKERAQLLGFPESEIPSAIDTALGGR